ncbi:MAG: hypothetical protein J1E83_12715 [Lachnospiraceae bacterium]|nr:hypothetical protein [Lachnospiraceae bacterium]
MEVKKNKEEYLMLREEILHMDSVINNTINFFYAFMASFLGFALTQSDNIFILVSYVIIIPAYLIVLNKLEGMGRIGAYLHVFQEGEKFNWETRNMEFMKRCSSRISAPNLPFLFVNFSVVVLLFLRTSWSSLSLYDILKLIFGVILFGSVSFLLVKNKFICTRDKISIWKEIKVSNSHK